ncbi:hypothetical protein [Clostridium sp. JS66]|uniref:hypothetical protein n=1 Tax=Clostridium sp. JS66 TaxID=3064705 RepID=UPI00298DD659|nr:hypothetical protein [Clostridium sp. JS66]WPC43837.1 hypothetical protein Q6H37_10275 [Clostridium sp. JS66]
MLLFLYIGCIIPIIESFVLINGYSKKLDKYNVSNENVFYYFSKKLFGIILLGFIQMMFIAFAVPSLIWNLGAKDVRVESKILQCDEIKPLSQANLNIYVKKVFHDNCNFYSLKKSDGIIELNSNSVEVLKANIFNKPTIQLVAEYKVKELKGNNMFINAVNDIYVNVYLSIDNATFVGNKNKLYIPNNSIQTN